MTKKKEDLFAGIQYVERSFILRMAPCLTKLRSRLRKETPKLIIFTNGKPRFMNRWRGNYRADVLV